MDLTRRDRVRLVCRGRSGCVAVRSGDRGVVASVSATESQRPPRDDSPMSEYDIGCIYGIWCLLSHGEWWSSRIESWRSNVTGRVEIRDIPDHYP